MTGWLVTGAGGMLGRDVVTSARRANGRRPHRTDLDITSRRIGRRRGGTGRTWSSTAPPGPPSTTPRRRPRQALAINGDGSAVLAEACAAWGTPAARLHRLRLRRRPAPVTGNCPRVRRDRSHRATDRTAAPNSPVNRPSCARRGLRGAHRLALRGPRPQLRPHDDRAGTHEADPRRGRRPTGPAHLDRATSPADWSPSARGQAVPGVYHVTGAGGTTWCGLAREVFAAVGADPERVRPTTTDKFPRPAPRPAYSVLGQERATAVGLAAMPDWAESVRAAVPLLLAAAEGN